MLNSHFIARKLCILTEFTFQPILHSSRSYFGFQPILHFSQFSISADSACACSLFCILVDFVSALQLILLLHCSWFCIRPFCISPANVIKVNVKNFQGPKIWMGQEIRQKIWKYVITFKFCAKKRVDQSYGTD